MSYNYTTYLQALRLTAVIDSSNAAFVSELPTIIDQAEQRCYRDLDLLATIVTDSSGTLTPNNRRFTLPQANGRFVVLQSVNILNGTSRTPCTKVSREVLDFMWPDDTAPASMPIPDQYAPLTDQIIMFGPSPSAGLNVECIGTIRPAPLSESNSETFLSLYLPDLFFAASMVTVTAYQQNFGAESDNPKMALSWEAQYQARLPSAQTEETRRKYQAFASV